MHTRGILGRIKYDAENTSGIITDDKKKLLKDYGIKKWDISHYKKKKFKLISKKKLPVMRKIIDGEIINSSGFIPFKKENEFAAITQKIIIERSFK